MLIYLVILAIGLSLVHLKIRYSKSAKLIDRIPGPTPLPLFGNLLAFNLTSEKLWLKILELLDQYYPILRVWFFNSAAVFIRHPDDLKILLSCKKNIDKAKLAYDNFRFIGNDGLIVSGGDKWRARRKMLAPAFSRRMLQAYTQISDERLGNFIASLRNNNSKETIVDLLPTLSKLNMGIIIESTMGVDMNKLSLESEEACRRTFHLICEVAFYRATRPYIKDWMMRFLSIGRKQAEALKTMRQFIRDIIEERRSYHERHQFETLRNLSKDNDDTDENANTEDNFTGSTGRMKLRLAVLDCLLAAQLDGLIDERGVREEVEIILAAGHDTTSAAMAFSLMLLAENPEAQERARDEVLAVANRNAGQLINSEIQNLEYLDRCVKESLRIFPPAPVIARYLGHDLHLDEYTVPAGNEAFINFYALHRDPNFWPQPDNFRPDRFLPENSLERHPFSYLPFSAGPRACNGQKLAIMELKTMLAHVLANFYIEAVQSTADLTFEMHVTLKPTQSIRAKLIRID